MCLEVLFTTKYSQPVSLNFGMIDVERRSCLLSVADDKHHDQSKRGRKVFISPQFISPLMGQPSEGTQNRDLEAAKEAETRGTLFSGLNAMACSACVLVQPRTMGPGVAPPLGAWVHPHQSLNKNMPYRLACR